LHPLKDGYLDFTPHLWASLCQWEDGLVVKKKAYEELAKRVEELEKEVTQRREVEEELQRHVAALERSHEEMKGCVYEASKDLQDDLDEVMRYLQFVEARYKGRLDSDSNDFIASAVRGASRMQKIITDLSAFSNINIPEKRKGPISLR
jgi:light-regulated signal transduction histidine kinase (bacteriophytochrome)